MLILWPPEQKKNVNVFFAVFALLHKMTDIRSNVATQNKCYVLFYFNLLNVQSMYKVFCFRTLEYQLYTETFLLKSLSEHFSVYNINIFLPSFTDQFRLQSRNRPLGPYYREVKNCPAGYIQ